MGPRQGQGRGGGARGCSPVSRVQGRRGGQMGAGKGQGRGGGRKRPSWLGLRLGWLAGVLSWLAGLACVGVCCVAVAVSRRSWL